MRLSLSLLALLLAAGCDGDSLLGEFVGQTQIGLETRTVDGEAVYTIAEGAYGPEFVLGLFVGDLYESDFDEYDYVLFRRPGGVPGVGAYAVDDDPVRAVAATIARADEIREPLNTMGALLQGVEGTLALSFADDYGNLAGSYRFSAEGVRLGSAAGRRVEGAASGTFEAYYVPPATFRRLGLDLGI